MIVNSGLTKSELEDIRRGKKRKLSNAETPKPKRRKDVNARATICEKIARYASPPRLLRTGSRSFETKVRSIVARSIKFTKEEIEKALQQHRNIEDAYEWLQSNAKPITPPSDQPIYRKDILFATIDTDGDGIITFQQILGVCKNTILKLVSKKDVQKQFYRACEAHSEVKVNGESTTLNYSQFQKVWNDFVDGIFENIDKEKNGSISGKQLYEYLYSIHGRPTWFAKSAIHRSFKKILVVAGEVDELSRGGALRVFSLWMSKQVKTDQLLTYSLRKTLGL